MSAFADSTRKVTLQFEQDPKKKVHGLTWNTKLNPEVQQRTKNEKLEFFIELQGSFKREDYSVLINSVAIPENQQQNFKKEILIKGPLETVTFSSIGPKGDLESEKVLVLIPEYQQIKSGILAEQTQKNLHFSASLGPSIVNYSQTDLTTATAQTVEYKQVFLTARLNATYALSNLWELSANTFYNAIKLSSDQTGTVPFLGFNIRAGYVLTPNNPKWRLVLNGGWYYVTTLGKSAGFQNLSGPQVFPLVKYSLAEAQSVFSYFKLSPISDKFSVLSFSNREIAFGGGYSFPMLGRSFTAGLDYSNIALTFSDTTTKSNSLTLSLGMGL